MRFDCFQVSKKKYQISTKTNTVYDITDRKVNIAGGVTLNNLLKAFVSHWLTQLTVVQHI